MIADARSRRSIARDYVRDRLGEQDVRRKYAARMAAA